MAFARGFSRWGLGLAAAAGTALLVWFGSGLNPWWPLAWLAPLPVLLFALRSGWRATAVAAAAGWLLGSANLLGYFRALGTPFWVWLGMFGMLAVAFAGAVLLFRGLAREGAWGSATVAFPAAWVSVEFLVNHMSVHGTAGNLAYTQMRCLPVLQLASVTGPWGISFALLLFPAAVATAMTAGRRARGPVLIAAGALVAVLVFGVVRLHRPQRGPMVRVGLATSDEPVSERPVQGAEAERLLRSYAQTAEELARNGARVVVLPEKLAVVTEGENAEVDGLFQPVADRTGATLVVGEVQGAGGRQHNQARVYLPGGAVALLYNKHHLLPPFESKLVPGTERLMLPELAEFRGRSGDAAGRVGVAICKDMDFLPLLRAYGRDGAGLMLVPAWDFDMDRVWHGHMAVMRGVEDGFSLVRSAQEGFVTVSDDRGRVLAERRSDEAPFVTLLATVPMGHEATVYGRWGDWFAWVAVGMLSGSLLRLLRTRRRV